LLLQSNPTLKLEFGSHTDSRGTFEYNDKLSNERAKSVVDYLVNSGIDRSRLSWKGYGKRHPLISKPATEGEHRMNRRTSFKIVEN
jgi:outer membrane protein OmpA-like peptidoglycan-associated protein